MKQSVIILQELKNVSDESYRDLTPANLAYHHILVNIIEANHVNLWRLSITLATDSFIIRYLYVTKELLEGDCLCNLVCQLKR